MKEERLGRASDSFDKRNQFGKRRHVDSNLRHLPPHLTTVGLCTLQKLLLLQRDVLLASLLHDLLGLFQELIALDLAKKPETTRKIVQLIQVYVSRLDIVIASRE